MDKLNSYVKEGVNMGYKEIEVKDMYKSFCLFDPENTGSVEQTEIMAILQSLGQNPTPDECDRIIQKSEKKSNQKITFLEFIRLAKDYIKDTMTLKDELKNAFLAFDTGNTGFISQQELKDILTSLGDRLDDDEIDEMFRLVEPDKDDRISYEEFINQFVVDK